MSGRRLFYLSVGLALVSCAGDWDPVTNAVVVDKDHLPERITSSTITVLRDCRSGTCPQTAQSDVHVPEAWVVHVLVQRRSGRSQRVQRHVSAQCYAAVGAGDSVDAASGCPLDRVRVP